MNSTRAPGGKRASLPRACDYTKSFAKDWVRLTHSGRFNMKQLKEAMLLLIANDAPLSPEWQDHPLTGEWVDHRECHVGGDFLLIYRLESRGAHELVIFVRAGTHADLFEYGTRLIYTAKRAMRQADPKRTNASDCFSAIRS